MPDPFSSPEHQGPRRQQSHRRPYPSPPSPRAPLYQPYPAHLEDPPHPVYPPPDPAPGPGRLTYPWQPRPRPAEPPPRRTPRHRPLGQHSDIRVLRGAYRRQRRVATLTALGYFTLFLLLSAFAPSLPGIPTTKRVILATCGREMLPTIKAPCGDGLSGPSSMPG